MAYLYSSVIIILCIQLYVMYVARHESILMSAGHSFVVFLVSDVKLAT